MEKLTIILVLLASTMAYGQNKSSGGSGGNVDLDDLEESAAEFVLNLQKFSVIAAGRNLLEGNNIELAAAYEKLKDIKEGNFKLHRYFIDDVLVVVKDEVKEHTRAIELLKILKAIRDEAKDSKSLIAGTGVFSEIEQSFWNNSYENVTNQALHLAKEYAIVITQGNLKANDGERILMIMDIHRDAVGLYNALRRFNNQLRLTVSQRSLEDEGNENLGNLVGL